MFQAGEVVWLLERVDKPMAWEATRAVVESCGDAAMTLTEEGTGRSLGRNFLPRSAQSGYVDGPPCVLVVRGGSRREVAAQARAVAQAVQLYEMALCRLRAWLAPCREEQERANAALAQLAGATFSLRWRCPTQQGGSAAAERALPDGQD